MKLSASLAALLLVDGAAAYAVAPLRAPALPRRAPPPAALLGPEHVDAFASAPDALHAASMLVADKASQAADAQLAIDAAARGMTVEALKAETGDLGWWGTYIKTVEDGILGLRDTLQGMGVAFPYGISIFCFVLGVKLVTLPLNWNQLSGAANMKSIKPQQDLIRKWYGDNQQILNMEIGGLFENQKINPLAGCLPSFAQIPIFIGLYRSVLNLAKEDKLTESFLWLPSLEGPVSDYTKGVGWLFGDEAQGYAWSGLTPPLGWGDTLAYLTLPVILVISQYISTSILTPKTDDPAQQQSQAILKFLPLMIGWFSLNVPSGLGLYWITNNVVTTLSTVLIRKNVQMPATANDAPVAAAAPPKPQGFGRSFGEVITKTDDSGGTVTISPPGTKRERRKAASADATVIEASVVADAAPMAPAVVDAAPAVMPATQVTEAPHMNAEAGGDDAAVSKPKKKRKKSKRKSKK